MAVIPKQTIPQRIDAVIVESLPRPHLGASIIGDPCPRKTAYSFYWAHKNKIDGRLERIFRLGDDIETQIIKALGTIGIEIKGTQRTIQDDTGHFGGSIDGIAYNVPDFDEPLLFEAKSMNHANFLEVVRKGVQACKPTHYVQMQMYMGEMDLHFALYVVYNKNDSKLHTEIVPFDVECYEKHVNLASDIIRMDHINEFPRISTNPSWYHCKFCGAKDVCHRGLKPERNCRTCQHSRLAEQGEWACTAGVGGADQPKPLSVAEQEAGCAVFTLDRAWQ